MILAKKAKTFLNILKEGVKRSQIDYLSRTIRDGKQNDFPQYLIDIVEKSPTTTACLERRHSFIQGKGLVGDVEDIPVNAEYNLGELHERVSSDFNYAGRFAIRIVPSKNNKIAELYHVPFEWVRYAEPDEKSNVDSVYVNPYILTNEETLKRKESTYPLFTSVEEMNSQRSKLGSEYKGHILFFNLTSQRNRHYSRPKYFAAEDYIRVDSKIGQFHDRNTDNNFFLGGIMNIVGDPNIGLVHDKEGEVIKTVGEEFEDRISDAFSGTGNAGSIMLNWVSDMDHAAEAKPWPGATHHELFQTVYNQSLEVISYSTGIPLILIGRATPGKLGQSTEMQDAIDFANERTEKFRRKLEQVYSKILPNLAKGYSEPEVKIDAIQSAEDLPDTVFKALTPKQRREYIEARYNIEPDEEGEIAEMERKAAIAESFTQNTEEDGSNNKVDQQD